MSEKEKRIKSIVRLHYSNPKVQEAIFSFAKDREVVPSYMMQAFGKRPDTLQYPSEIMNLVNKGATSFHCSEELWENPLDINSDMAPEEFSDIRKGWDLLIDIDSPYLDYSKIAAELILEELENYGIKNYGIKFSGSKGFHLIVPFKAFPMKFNGIEAKRMFPEWPRAICGFLLEKIRPKYNTQISISNINFKALKERTNLSKEDISHIACPNCGSEAKKTKSVSLKCDRCSNLQIKPDYKITKRKLRCIEESCPGFYNVKEEKDLFLCEKCSYSSLNKLDFKSGSIIRHTKEAKNFSEDFKEEVMAEKLASLDLILVAPRHLFRMPYSLHEKTALASIILTKEQIKNFNPQDANPLKVKIQNFYPSSKEGEASSLLESALAWKQNQEEKYEKEITKKYKNFNFNTEDIKNVPEEIFPKPIKKLLNGLAEGRKRGLFILLAFLRCLNFSPEYINVKIREWNKKNSPPLKEGYVRSQIDWHLRQKRKILPPNYSNESFYKDLNLMDKKPNAKNPVSEVIRLLRKNS